MSKPRVDCALDDLPALEDLTHIVCCDDFIALCGQRLKGIDCGPLTDEPQPDDCPTCVIADQLSPDTCRLCEGTP